MPFQHSALNASCYSAIAETGHLTTWNTVLKFSYWMTWFGSAAGAVWIGGWLAPSWDNHLFACSASLFVVPRSSRDQWGLSSLIRFSPIAVAPAFVCTSNSSHTGLHFQLQALHFCWLACITMAVCACFGTLLSFWVRISSVWASCCRLTSGALSKHTLAQILISAFIMPCVWLIAFVTACSLEHRRCYWFQSQFNLSGWSKKPPLSIWRPL